MKKFFGEFKAFVLKGNVLNLAVGIIIGAAFQGLVASFTDNILSPVIGLFAGQDFSALQVNVLGVTIAYGAFITSAINFLILALVVFLIVKWVSRLMPGGKKKTEAPPAVKPCPYCFSEIDVKATRCPACTSQLAEA